MPKTWMRIRVEYLDGSEAEILKSDLDRIREILPVIEAFNEAKN